MTPPPPAFRSASLAEVWSGPTLVSTLFTPLLRTTRVSGGRMRWVNLRFPLLQKLDWSIRCQSDVDGCPRARPPLLPDHGRVQHHPRSCRHRFLCLLCQQTFPYGTEVRFKIPLADDSHKFLWCLQFARIAASLFLFLRLAAVLHLLVAACAVTVLQ